MFAAGRSGERFCVRNSGAIAVVEGVGDHGCEYMTAGVVVVLGEVGRNFAAGMTGGAAYVFDEFDNFQRRCNDELVTLVRICDQKSPILRALIERHYELTGSPRARKILGKWERVRSLFWHVVTQAEAQSHWKGQLENSGIAPAFDRATPVAADQEIAV